MVDAATHYLGQIDPQEQARKGPFIAEQTVLTDAAPNEDRERLSRLELTFASRDGQTYLADALTTSPLKVVRPFALGDGRVLLQLLNVGPGLLAGDCYELNIHVKTGAKVVLVNQSATKLHRTPPGRWAQQRLHVTLEPGADLELYPGLTIPFSDSDTRFETTVQLAGNARFAVLELFAMGRVRRGEAFAFRRLSSRLRVVQDGRLVYADGLELSPEIARHTGLTDGFTYLASGFWRWDVPWPELAQPDVQAVTGLCGPERGYLRALGRDGLELTKSVRAQLGAWQQERGVTPLPFERLLL